MTLHDIISALKKSKSIIILPHISADGDALGSGLALALALKRQNRGNGKDIKLYIEEAIPRMYSFLPDREIVEVYSDKHRTPVKNADNNITDVYETVIAIDTGDMERLGKRAEIFNNAELKINIDHHATNTLFGNINYVNEEASATGEIIYQLIKMMGSDIDRDIALCLYVAITTDTGGFRYSNTTPLTHLITSDLIGYGINIADVSFRVFDSISEGKLKLMGMAINSLELYEQKKIAFITVTEKMIEEAGAVEEESEGLVNLGRNINTVEVAALFKLKPNDEIKISMRSNSYIDVSKIASRYNGGGHKKAAGCTIMGNLNDVRNLILKELIEALEEKANKGSKK